MAYRAYNFDYGRDPIFDDVYEAYQRNIRTIPVYSVIEFTRKGNLALKERLEEGLTYMEAFKTLNEGMDFYRVEKRAEPNPQGDQSKSYHSLFFRKGPNRPR